MPRQRAARPWAAPATPRQGGRGRWGARRRGIDRTGQLWPERQSAPILELASGGRLGGLCRVVGYHDGGVGGEHGRSEGPDQLGHAGWGVVLMGWVAGVIVSEIP